MRRFYPEEVIRRFTFTSILRKIEIIRWIGYSEGKKNKDKNARVRIS